MKRLHTYNEILTNQLCATLVLAGPGSGKTYLLANRAKWLIDKGAKPGSLTMLAFGRDAAANMLERLTNPTGDFKLDRAQMKDRVSTMHALGLELVQDNAKALGLKSTGLKVLDDERVRNLLFRDAAFISGGDDELAKQALRCKQTGACAPKNGNPSCSACAAYRDILRKCNCVDFDDQILLAIQVLESDEAIKQKYQKKATHLLVDEYQDINAAQHKLILILSEKNRGGLFAVGDDAQSIYSFRGGNPSFILGFEESVGQAALGPLGESRRCHAGILENASRFLKKHYRNWTGPFKLNYHKQPGLPPQAWEFQSAEAEADGVAAIASYYLSKRKSVLVLVPKKDLYNRLSKAMTMRGVPFDCPDPLLPANLALHMRVADVFAKWVAEPDDNFSTRVVLEELLNRGPTKVAGARRPQRTRPETIEMRTAAEKSVAALWGNVSARKSLHQAVGKNQTSHDFIDKASRVLSNLIDAYENSAATASGALASKLAEATGLWPRPADLVADISRLQEHISRRVPTGPRQAQMTTMKKAKGLEADVVIVPGMEDDLVPRPRADIEEEARLFYVTMTRARDLVFLTHSTRRPRGISFGPEFESKKRSPFIDDLGIDSKAVAPWELADAISGVGA